MGNIRVIIAGGRSFNHYGLLNERCSFFIGSRAATIISGTAQGADKFGELFASEHGHGLERHPAEWERYGKRAGYVRNEAMAKVADCLIAFWDGKSRGTKHMINLAKKHGLKVRVVKY